jgi:hypothetical protein
MNINQALKIVEAQVEFNASLPEDAKDSEYLVPMLWSLPGEGKTSGIKALCDQKGWDFRSVIFAQFDPGELGGFPVIDKEEEQYIRYAPFYMKNFDPEKITILLLDELPQAPVANLNIAAQLVNERAIGEHRLPPNVFPVGAGNPMSARAGTNQMPSQLKDRFNHLEIETCAETFRAHALQREMSPVITDFINNRPEWLQKFDPNQNASPSPRSWERVNSMLQLNLTDDLQRFSIEGQVGQGAVTDFFGHLQMFDKLPDVEKVVFVNPTSAPIPDQPDILYALCSNMAHKVTKKTAKALVTYIRRFDNAEFAAFCVRDTLARNEDLRTNPDIANWMVKEGKDLLL